MTNKWHVVVNGEPACSHRVLLEDRRLPFAAGFCSSFDRERVEQVAAGVRALYPDLHVEVDREGCHDGIF